MSQNIDLKPRESHNVAPTPQNTPLQNTTLASRPAGQGVPTVEAIGEDDDGEEEAVGANPASLLAAVSMRMGLLSRSGRLSSK